METEKIVNQWFDCWEKGALEKLPISESFSHTSPFGVIQPKSQYMQIVEANTDKFLNHRFEIHDAFYSEDKAVVRYTAYQNEEPLDVSEWYYIKNGLIESIISHYHIGDIKSESRIEM